jgi:UDP-N-acetylglucosamine 2-epimerase (non-hydrolysing)
VTDRVVHVVGARPNFMKAGPVVKALARRDVEQLVIHTGQHYDRTMSDIFFSELGLPEPDFNLGVGSGSQAVQTAALLTALEPALLDLDPALTVVYGDINSTLATSLVASKLHLATAHVEAGLRSFDMTMPEEVNRRVTDILSDLLFATSPEALDNLAREGVAPERVHFVGNPMIDTLLANLDRFDVATARAEYRLDGPYAVATLHRPANVDTPEAAAKLVSMLQAVMAQLPVVLPLHPRGRAMLAAAGLADGPRLRLVEPLGYIAFLSLVRGAAVVVTDSGGIQEETTILGVPCLTVRPNTERPITITHGTNRLVEPGEVGPWVARILAAANGSAGGGGAAPGGPGSAPDAARGARVAPGGAGRAEVAPGGAGRSEVAPGGAGRSEVAPGGAPAPEPPPLWDGHAGERIADVVTSWLGDRPQAS